MAASEQAETRSQQQPLQAEQQSQFQLQLINHFQGYLFSRFDQQFLEQIERIPELRLKSQLQQDKAFSAKERIRSMHRKIRKCVFKAGGGSRASARRDA